MRWSNQIVRVLVGVGAVALTACKENDRESSSGTNAVVVTQAPAAPARSAFGKAPGVVGDVSGALRNEVAVATMADTFTAAPAPAPPGTATTTTSTSMIIRTGTATIKVDTLEPAVARLRALAVSVGGYVGNTSMQTGSDELRSATVEIKVPATRWGQLVSGLKPIGTLESENENAEDVGEEFVDVQARVANAKRLEARLIDLLANRTGKLSDALEVERELARVREEIERYQGRIRYLQTRAAISTMTVTVHEPAPVLGSHPGDNPIAQAFRDAWRIFVGLIAFFIASLGVIVPLAVIGLVVWMLRGRWKRTG